MNRYEFDGRVALVTGAGSGIGEACAATFARDGASVIVSDIDPSGGKRVVEAIEKGGGKAHFVQADVADPEAMRALVDEAVSTFGKLDVAVNNAGVGGEIAPVAEYSIDGWRKRCWWVCILSVGWARRRRWRTSWPSSAPTTLRSSLAATTPSMAATRRSKRLLVHRGGRWRRPNRLEIQAARE